MDVNVHKRYEPADTNNNSNETYILSIIPYIPQKVVEILKKRREK
jgi:hypothetical protein